MKVRILHIFIAVLLILVIFSSKCFATLNVQGVEVEDPLTTDVVDNSIENQVDEWGENGTGQTIANSGETSSHELENSNSILDTIATVLGWIISIVPFLINFILSLVVGTDTFSIQDLLLGNYELFHINVFDVDGLSGNYATMMQTISNSVSLWYTAIRNLSVVALAIILIYVGIRMAISSVAEDKAKYKIMLKNWFIALVLIFLLHYIVIILMELSELFVRFVKNSISQSTNVIGMEETILNDSFANIAASDGLDKVLYIIAYFLMVYYQFKFFLIYIMRVFKIDFLIMIAPLICITYPIDTIADNKAQAFNNWIKQIVGEIFLQPIHLCIYVVFIYSAGAIAVEAPIVAIMFFAALSNGEKIVRRAFKAEVKGLKDIKMPKI